MAVASAGLIALFAALSYEAYARGGYWLDFVAPVTGMLAYRQGARMVARRRLRRTFGEFVSPEVVARVARDGATLGGELRRPCDRSRAGGAPAQGQGRAGGSLRSDRPGRRGGGQGRDRQRPISGLSAGTIGSTGRAAHIQPPANGTTWPTKKSESSLAR